MNASAGFGALRFRRYLNLETYRKNGKPVRTPVWFALARGGRSGTAGETIYVYTTADSGKVKRIRNNPAARIAPCDPFGWLNGRWIEVQVEIITGEEARHGMRSIACKYIPWKQFLDVLSAFSRHQRVVLAIRPI
jgi:PPOX class probable F420-dependent enzyme